MDRNSYGNTAAIISNMQIPPGGTSDTLRAQLIQMLHNPKYAGFTNIIIAKLTELSHGPQQQAEQTPPAPTVAQQAVQGTPIPQPPQGMAKGGIIAFRHGGKIRKFDDGGYVDPDIATMEDYTPKSHKLSSSWFPSPQMLGYPVEPTAPPASTAPAAPTTPPPSVRPVVVPEQPYTLQGTGGLRLGAKGLAGLGDYTDIPTTTPKSLSDYVAEENNIIPENKDLIEARKNMADIQAGRKQETAQAPWMALMRAGLGVTQAATDPHTSQRGIFGQLGAGATEGFQSYVMQREQLQKAQENEIANQLKSGEITRQEAMDKLKVAQSERRADITDQKTIQVANQQARAHLLGLGMQADIMNKPAQQTLAMAQHYGQQRYNDAVNAYNQDSQHNPPPGHIEDYISDAMMKFSPVGMVGQSRVAAAQSAARIKEAQTALSSGTADTPARRAYYQNIITEELSKQPGGSGASGGITSLDQSPIYSR